MVDVPLPVSLVLPAIQTPNNRQLTRNSAPTKHHSRAFVVTVR